MLKAGTYIIARDLRVVVSREDVDAPAVYGNVTIKGRIMDRDPSVFVGWSVAFAPVFEPGPDRPTRDQCGYYWVKPNPVTEREVTQPIMVHESELEVAR